MNKRLSKVNEVNEVNKPLGFGYYLGLSLGFLLSLIVYFISDSQVMFLFIIVASIVSFITLAVFELRRERREHGRI